MLYTKFKAVAAFVLMLGFFATGATLLVCRTAAGQDDKKSAAKKPVQPTEKQEKDKEIVTAWGTEVGGLQAGLGFRPGENRDYRLGETVTLVVRVRNVGKETVTFEYVKQFLDEKPPTVTDIDGKSIRQAGTTILGFHFQVKVTLEPGKEIVLESRIHGASGRRYELLPASDGKATTKEWPLFVVTGRVCLQYDRVLGNSSSGGIKLHPGLEKLATGKLELEVKPDPPPAAENKGMLSPKQAVRLKTDVNKVTVEFKVEHVTKSTLVKADSGKDAGWVSGHGPDDRCLRPQPFKEEDKGQAIFERQQPIFEAILTDKAIKQLNRAGIMDVAKHCKSKTVRVTGKLTWRFYDGFGTPPVVEVVIDDLSQLEVVD